MARVIPPPCPVCGASGADGDGGYLVRRIYEQMDGRNGRGFRAIGWKCPIGHLFSDAEGVAAKAALSRE
jgi:hypothetical protein